MKVTILYKIYSNFFLYIMEYTKEGIKNNIITWVQFNLEGFEFRKYQCETIVDIIYNILNPDTENTNNCQIIEAPTGSGKSIINIIAGCVLAEYYGLRSYILASDLYLWQQYYDFIQSNMTLRDKIGCLKGKFGNYKCRRNNEDLSSAECKMAGLSWASLYSSDTAKKHGFDCAKNCKYIKERKHALKTKVTLMTYQLYALIVDEKNEDDKVPVFDVRDVIFCDECHNIPNIVQMQVSPTIKYSDANHLFNIYNYACNNGLDLFDDVKEKMIDPKVLDKYPTLNDLMNKWNNLFEIASNYKNSKEDDYKNIIDILHFFTQFNVTINYICDDIMKRIKEHSIVTKEDMEIYKECDHVVKYINPLLTFQGIIAITGVKYFVKQINKKEEEISSIEYHCAKEDFLVYLFMLTKTRFKVMLSATVGDQESYEDSIGIKYFGMRIKGLPIKEYVNDITSNSIEENLLDGIEKIFDESTIYTRIPSTFNFTNSPIHFYNRYKMSFRDQEQSINSLKPIIYKLLEQQFPNQRGIIQTGSYKIAQDIIKNAPVNIKNRLLYYNGSHEKISNVTIHKMSTNTILIGPTLNEGIDLPGDQCRFIMILKVPYPQMKDRLVEAKMNLFPTWYNYTTSNLIIQGIGRGNRFKDDWCITYIFDACFYNLFLTTKEQYPKELQDRLRIYN